MVRHLLSITACLIIVMSTCIHAEQTIQTIEVVGNTLIPDTTVLTKTPYAAGKEFDPHAARKTIHALYQLGLFQNIRVRKKEISPSQVKVIIELEEKDRVEHISFHGNKAINASTLSDRIEAESIKTLDHEEARQLERNIQRAYQEKNYHNAQVETQIERTSDKRINVHFCINEGKRSVVKRVRFIGNECIPSKELRKNIFTREEWILSFFDKAGTYHPDAVEQDKYMIEHMYQDNGFLAARVTDVDVATLDDGNFMVTFTIDEGDIYTISDIHIEGNDILTEHELLCAVPIAPGDIYSRQAIRDTMEQLRTIWGEYGYVYADIQPSLQPDQDNKTVHVTFYSQLGNRMFVDRINIVGNYRTSENVVRRQLSLDEGDMITQRTLDNSKYRVQALGYFAQQSGVTWRFKKKDEENVELDLVLNEIKTGTYYASLGINASGSQSPTDGASLNVGLRNLNMLGTGIQYNISGSWSKNDQSVDASMTNNWLFDKPVASTVHVFSRKSLYEDFTSTTTQPEERISGGMVSVGARPQALGYTQLNIAAGLDDIRYTTNIVARPSLLYEFYDPTLREAVSEKITRSFQPGTMHWVATSTSQDYRNHPYFPSRGYVWNFDAKLALPTTSSTDFSFFKMGLSGHWYTPLIGEHTLVLHGYGFVGAITEVSNREVPYRELYHIGGATTVRGYEFGHIGPQLLNDSLGGKKSLITNVELLFPITGDGNLRGVFFYDGGASWDTPEIESDLLRNRIQNNTFEYRHSIGFGFRASSPTPIRVDWGFKLDRKKIRNEDISKVHITMSQDF